jgi:hypothetical protein
VQRKAHRYLQGIVFEEMLSCLACRGQAVGRDSNAAAIMGLEKKVHRPARKQSLRALRNYIEGRREMLNYARALREEWDNCGISELIVQD